MCETLSQLEPIIIEQGAQNQTALSNLDALTFNECTFIYTQFLWYHLHNRIHPNTKYTLKTDHTMDFDYFVYAPNIHHHARFSTRHYLSVNDIDADNELQPASEQLLKQVTLSLIAVKTLTSALQSSWSDLCNQLQLPFTIYSAFLPFPNSCTNYGVGMWITHCQMYGLECIADKLRINAPALAVFNCNKSIPMNCVTTKRNIWTNDAFPFIS